jgi:hypothetical protein
MKPCSKCVDDLSGSILSNTDSETPVFVSLCDDRASAFEYALYSWHRVSIYKLAKASFDVQSVHAKKAETWQTQFAPEPREVIWANLGISWWEKFVRQSAVYGVTFLIVFFFMIPITIVSGFSTLDNLKKFASFLNPVFDM